MIYMIKKIKPQKSDFSKFTKKIQEVKKTATKSQNALLTDTPSIISSPTTDVYQPRPWEDDFEYFQKKCDGFNDESTTADLIAIKKEYNQILSRAQIRGRLKCFLSKTEILADNLCASKIEILDDTPIIPNSGMHKRLAGILYSQLIKIYQETNQNKKVIEIADKCIPLHKEKNDFLHIRSRLTAKRNAYKMLGDKKNNYKTLKQELKYLKAISINYQAARDNFNSLEKPPSSLKQIYKEIASVSEILAEMTAHKKRNQAINYLIEWKHAVENLGERVDKIELSKIERRFENIKTSPVTNKLQKCTLSDIRKASMAKARRSLGKKQNAPLSLCSYKKAKSTFESRFPDESLSNKKA